MENPKSGLAEKVIGYQFSEKIEVTDPYTRKKDRKPLKPFMVNNSVNIFEKGKIIIDHKDKTMIDQLEGYRVVSISSTGLPIYSDENEHAIDAMNLALLIFAQKYDSLLKKVCSSKIMFIGNIDDRSMDVSGRNMNNKIDINSISSVIKNNKNFRGECIGVVDYTSTKTGIAKQNYKNAFKRRSF